MSEALFLIPAEDVVAAIDPYVEVLEPFRFDRHRIIEHALNASVLGNFSMCHDLIEDDIVDVNTLSEMGVIDKETVERIVVTAMDAVDDALISLRLQLSNCLGFVPQCVIVHRFVGDSPVISLPEGSQ